MARRRRKKQSWNPEDYRDGSGVFYRRLSSAMETREEMEQRWQVTEGLFGDFDIEQWTTRDFDIDMSSGFVVSTLETIVAGVSQPNPKISLTATVPGQEDFAMASDRLVNSYWTRYNMGQQFLMGVFDADAKGLGVWKTLWKREIENVLLPNEEVERLVQESVNVAQQDENVLIGGKRVKEMSNEEVESRVRDRAKQVRVDKVTVDRPMMRRVSPWLFYADPQATCNEDMRWCCEGVWMSVADVQDNPRFNSTVRKKVEPTQRSLSIDRRTDRTRLTDRVRRDREDQRDVLVWEYWSIEDGVFAMWADGMDEYLLRPTSIPYLFGHPYVFARPGAPPDQFYGIPAGWRAAKAELQANYTLTQRTAHANQYANKYVVDRNILVDDNEEALASVTPNEVVAVDLQPGQTIDQSIKALRPQALPADTYSTEESMKQVWHRMTAMDQYAEGMTQNIRRTAEEASMLAQAGRDRFAHKTMIYENAVGDICRNLIALAQQFLSSEEVVGEVGKDGSSMSWTRITPEDLQEGMRFNYSVEMGSLAPADVRSQRRDLTEMYQMLLPMVELGVVNPAKLAEDVLRAFGKMNPEEYLMQQQPQQQIGAPNEQTV